MVSGACEDAHFWRDVMMLCVMHAEKIETVGGRCVCGGGGGGGRHTKGKKMTVKKEQPTEAVVGILVHPAAQYNKFTTNIVWLFIDIYFLLAICCCYLLSLILFSCCLFVVTFKQLYTFRCICTANKCRVRKTHKVHRTNHNNKSCSAQRHASPHINCQGKGTTH